MVLFKMKDFLVLEKIKEHIEGEGRAAIQNNEEINRRIMNSLGLEGKQTGSAELNNKVNNKSN